MKFNKNIGTIDFFIRILIGAIFIYLGFINTQILNDSISSIILGVCGIIALATAIFRFCPLYLFIGFSSKKSEQ